VARQIDRGDVWLHRFAAPDKRRPIVVISRQDAIAVLSTVLVAPITSTIRGLPSEVALDVDDGLKGPCAVNLDHVQTVRKADLQRHIVTLRPARMAEICRALSVATGCS
jgi:mRNA interferase MazF